jgi:hypothetical protein
MPMIDAMDVLKNKGTPAVPVPLPTNEAIYEVATDVGKRTLWSASPRCKEGVGAMLIFLVGSSLFSWSSRRWASMPWRSVSPL